MNTIRSRQQPSRAVTTTASGNGDFSNTNRGGGSRRSTPFDYYGGSPPKSYNSNSGNGDWYMQLFSIRGLMMLGCLFSLIGIYVFGFLTVVHRAPVDQHQRFGWKDPKLTNLRPQQLQNPPPPPPKEGQDSDASSHWEEHGHKLHQPPKATTIGFAVTITGCGSDPITEGAAVLQHSIHLASIHGNMGGRYDYKLYAIYHPDGASCAMPLKDLGYTLLQRDTPVAVADIEGDFLRENIEKNGCCGEKELVKLEAYTLIDHPVVVHLDLDVLVLKPMDALFDWMIFDMHNQDGVETFDASDVPIMWPEEDRPHQVNAFFTRDYNMVGPSRKYKPVQGGFLVLRPNMTVYEEYVDIVKKGDFRDKGGWGGVVGPFYGSMTFQGIIPYYYDYLHLHQAVELNRCVYNQMADNPKDKRTVNDIPQGRCRTNEEECEDCRNRPLEDVVTTHFTLCQKPWLCLPQDSDVIQQRLCRKLHHQWHRIRSDLEQSWGRPEYGPGDYHRDHFYGHCSKQGKQGYLKIEQPYGKPLQTTK